jgi:hypothetical protein
MGQVIRSGDLHFRTVSVVNEADGQRVSAGDLVGVYSPGTMDHDLKVDRESWWQPATEEYGWGRGGMSMIEIAGFEDRLGCVPGTPEHPGRLRVNIWNLRMLRTTSYSFAPPMIEAKLAISKRQITGTISNKSAVALHDIVIRAHGGVAMLKDVTVAPGQSATVNATVRSDDRTFDTSSFAAFIYRDPSVSFSGRPSLSGMAYLPGSIEPQVDLATKTDAKAACIYAQFDGPAATADLPDPVAKRAQIGMLRSLVHME